MSPNHSFSDGPSESNSSDRGDALAKEFYKTVKKQQNASARIEAALKTFCDDFSLEEANSGHGFHPSLDTLSQYLEESADTNFFDLNDRFRRGRRIIEQIITAHLGTNEASIVARQIVNDSFVSNMGACLTKQIISSTIEEHYLKLRERHLEPFLLRTESCLQYLHFVEKNTPDSSNQAKEAQNRLIADCEAAANGLKAHLNKWAYLLENHFPSLISDAADQLKELAPELSVSFRDALKEELSNSFQEQFVDTISQIIQIQSAEIALCVTAMKQVFSPDVSEQNE